MLSRRAFLADIALAGAGGLALAGCSSSGGPSPTSSGKNAGVTPKRIPYGADASQFGELYVPTHPFHAGTVVIVHGGFWRAQYGLDLGRPLAADLMGHGYTCWNLEYRRVGDGGGWPSTLADIAAGIDRLASIDGVDTSAVVAVGHSAGGQLSAWAAGRSALPADAPGSAPKVRVSGVVSQAGVLDLLTAQRTAVGGTAVSDLLGGTPDTVADRYRLADPIQQVPLSVPVLCVHSRADQEVPYAQSTAYVAAATKAGGHARLDEVAGDHYVHIDPSSKAWRLVRDALPALSSGRLP